MDPLDDITLSLAEFPDDMSVGELKEYLLQQYPESYINLTYSKLARFGRLDKNILSDILAMHAKESLPLINKSVRGTIPSIDQICNKPVSSNEIYDYLTTEHTITIIEEKDDGTYIYDCKFNLQSNSYYQEYDWLDTVEAEFKNGKTIGVDEENIITIYELDKAEVPASTFKTKIDGHIDLFSEYYIMEYRTECRNNINIKEHLLDRYNNEIAPEINYPFTYQDIEKVFIVNQLAKIIESDSAYEFDRQQFNLSLAKQHKYKDNIMNIFNESRSVIRDHIIRLTNAYVEDDIYLYLVI